MLRHRAGANEQVLRKPLDHRHQRIGHHQPAEPPAGHVEVFAEAVDADDLVVDGQCRLAIRIVVRQAEVDFVDQRDAAVPRHDLVDATQLVGCNRRAGRVRRRCQQHAARPLGPCGLDLGCTELKALGSGCRDQHGTAVGGAHEMAIARVARVRQQHLVAGLDQRQASQLQGGRSAGSDDDAAGRHIDAEALRVPAADALAQAVEPHRLRVLRGATVNRPGSGFLYQRRRGEVRLADIEENHRPAGVGHLARHRSGGFGDLHHIERLDAFGALRDPHATSPWRRCMAATFIGPCPKPCPHRLLSCAAWVPSR